MSRSIPFLAPLMVLALAACDVEAPSTPAETATLAEHGALHQRDPDRTPELNRQLAQLRQATAQFHNFQKAQDAGYTYLFMNMCMEHPELGGMGYHWVNTDLLDGEVEIAHPEALLYERGPSGQFRLTGVEYVIPEDQWSGPGEPTLFGKKFTLNQFGLWALHVWIWKDNPTGMFKDWNPAVSCP